MIGSWRLWTAIGLVLTFLTLGASQAAARGSSNSAGRSAGTSPAAVRDPTFGDKGQLILSSESASTAYGRATPEADLLVSGGSSIQLVNRVGGIGEAFGGVGSVIFPPAIGEGFQLANFTIDPQGRLLVVGTSLFPESENPSPVQENGGRAFRPGEVQIFRLLPDGQLDPSFGQGGIVKSDFGLPPPLGRDGRPLGTHPALRATGIAISPQGRIVVTGSAVVGLGSSCVHDIFAPVGISTSFVVRLTEGGSPDATFAQEGLVGGRASGEAPLGAEQIGDPIVGPGGQITYRSTGSSLCRPGRSHRGIAQLTPSGQADRVLGKRGAIFGPYRALAQESDGSVLALAEVSGRREDASTKARLIKIAPSGRLDRSFGEKGRVTLRFRRGVGISLDALAVDGRGRILLGGILKTARGDSIVLMRVSARGRLQKDFGPHSRVVTQVPRPDRLGPGDLFFDPEGRLVALDQFSSGKHEGLVVTRYLLRH